MHGYSVPTIMDRLFIISLANRGHTYVHEKYSQGMETHFHKVSADSVNTPIILRTGCTYGMLCHVKMMSYSTYDWFVTSQVIF